MKQSPFLLTAAFCILVASCSKDQGFFPGSDPSQEPSAMYAAQGSVTVLHPDNDGENDGDTDDLMAAIEAAGNGGCVSLTAGTFRIAAVDINGFRGKICGAGQNKTFIVPDGKIEVQPQSGPRNLLPAWWRITGGDVTISDLTFRTGDGTLLSDTDDLFNKSLASLLAVNNYSEEFGKDDPQTMNFVIRNVGFLGGKMDPAQTYLESGFNVIMPLWIGMLYWWPPLDGIELTKGTYQVAACNFSSFMQGPEFFSFGEEACGTIDRIKTNDTYYGVYCTANYGGNIAVYNSEFRNSLWNDIMLEDNDWGLISNVVPVKRTMYNISGNTFFSMPKTTSLKILDTWGINNPEIYKPSLAVIKNNHFMLGEEGVGISLLNNQNGQVRNNRFTGTGVTGVLVDGAEVTDPVTMEVAGTSVSKFALIMGNNFTGLKPSGSHIYLGKNSYSCTVIGNGKESVINEGKDNHIVGMKPMPGFMFHHQKIHQNIWLMHRNYMK